MPAAWELSVMNPLARKITLLRGMPEGAISVRPERRMPARLRDVTRIRRQGINGEERRIMRRSTSPEAEENRRPSIWVSKELCRDLRLAFLAW